LKTKPTVLLTHRFIPTVIDAELKPHAHVLIARDRKDLERKIALADGLITRPIDRVDEKLLSRAPRLRAVANFAVGYDNIDLSACARRGIRVTNTPGVLTRATAELTLALLLAAARRLPEGERLCRDDKPS
jgi:lactate dehydrogenase-like 2-hydroxyacid dehydrogenase